MTDRFISEDEANCPCVTYEVGKVVDPFTDQQLVGDYYGFEFSMNSTGFFKVANYSSYHKFHIWISCNNSAGVYSGMRAHNNIVLEWENPNEQYELPVWVANETLLNGDDDKVMKNITEYINVTAYRNNSWYNEPAKFDEYGLKYKLIHTVIWDEIEGMQDGEIFLNSESAENIELHVVNMKKAFFANGTLLY